MPENSPSANFMVSFGAGQSEIKVTLRNGRSLRIRPGCGQDHLLLKTFFERLSPKSKYLRFGCQKSSFRDEEIENLAKFAPPDCYVLVAIRGEGKEERIVALANWALLADGKRAEVSFVVEDSIQLRGVGTALLGVLAREAAFWGIEVFLAYVLPQNAKMMEVFENSGFGVKKMFCEDNFEVQIFIASDAGFRTAEARRHRTSCCNLVNRFLDPQNIVLVADSASARFWAPDLKNNIIASGFTGTVSVAQFPSRRKEVMLYPSLPELPGLFDLAILGLNRRLLPEAIVAGVKRGIAFFVAAEAGVGRSEDFSGNAGDKIVEVALAYGVRILGPASGGLLNNASRKHLNATLFQEPPPPGRISVAFNRKSHGWAVMEIMKKMNLGVNHAVGLGEACDVHLWDLLEFWEEDEHTEAVLLVAAEPPVPPGWPPAGGRLSGGKRLAVISPALLDPQKEGLGKGFTFSPEVRQQWQENLARNDLCFLGNQRDLQLFAESIGFFPKVPSFTHEAGGI